MSKITNRDSAPRDRDPVEQRLARLLDTPLLARVVPHLPPETLHQLIRHRGLDACGELVAAATPAQLTAVLDLDLWRHARPGRDHLFDVDRFGEWLEALVDSGDAAAARTVAALDKDLVVAGLSRYLRVFDPGIFEPTAQSDDEPTVRHDAMPEGDAVHDGVAPVHDASSDPLECEVGGYLLRARRGDAWDAIVALLVALAAEHGSDFEAVMQGCRRLSNSRPEVDGLDDLLLAPEQHLHDVSIERERRRSRQGYATPAEARAFLEMARQPKHPRERASIAAAIGVNPIVRAYFRAADEAPQSSNEAAPSPERTFPSDVDTRPTGVSQSLEAVMELLTEAGVMPARPRALLEAAHADPQTARLTRLRRLMAYLRDAHEAAYFTRSRELAFLGNTLLAGCSVQSRPFTAQEASDAAAAICNLGLEHWPARGPGATSPGASLPGGPRPRDTARRLRQGSGRHADTPPNAFPADSWLVDHDLVTAFEVGWSVLHHDVSLFAAEQLISTLTGLDCADRDIRRGLAALRRTLAEQRDAGTPWHAREAAEILAMLDMTAWISVLGLLDECPVLPAALTAVLEGRTTTVSPTAFEFISSVEQIGDVRLFMRKLPDLLAG